MNFKFELLEKETLGTIELNDKVHISDPCYSVDTWCAGTLKNVLPGIYHCFYQKVDNGDWGTRIASIEVRHENYLDIEPTEVTNIDVGVDSGQAGIYDLDYFAKNREDKYGEDVFDPIRIKRLKKRLIRENTYLASGSNYDADCKIRDYSLKKKKSLRNQL